MPQVPYTGVPGQVLADIPTPEMNPRVPSAAFGGEVAQAISGLGKTVAGAGDEIFNRAIALQNLNNETEASEADAKYMIQAGQIHADYNAKEGIERVRAFPKYQQDLQKARQDIRGSLSSPMSQKMYDRQSLSTMGRSIFNGAGAAATAQRQYVVGTAAANMDLDAKSVEDDPKDPRLFKEKLNKTKQNAAILSAAKGFEDGGPQERDLAMKATSRLWAQRIVGHSRIDPFGAAKELDENKTELTQDDYLKVDNTVRAQGRAVGSVNIANQVFDEGKGDDQTAAKPLSIMEAEARAKAKAFNPDDPILEQHAVAAVRGIWNQANFAKKQEDYDNKQTIAGAIGDGVRDEQQLRANPKVAAAIDALPKSDRLNIPARINSYNAAKNKVANEELYNQLVGMSSNDVEGFLNIDPYQTGLNQSQMDKVVKRQEQLKKNQNQDPRVDRAMGWMRGAMGSQMQALDVYKRTVNNKDDYDHLTGTVQSALDIWQENHGKPPTYKEFTDQIAPQVIQQRTEKGWIWNSQKPFFNQDTPDKFSEQVKADVISQGGVEPTPEQLNRAYVRSQLIKLYPPSKKSP
jgi:hypothetical protein